MKPLYIFDFDDTLALTNSKIVVIRPDGSELELDSAEFAKYRSAPGDQFDFSQFGEGSPITGTLIDSTVAELKKAMSTYGNESVYIVTARSASQPVVDFLESMGIPSPPVIATTGSEGKAPWLREKLESEPYTDVFVFEDCSKNISMLSNVVDDFNQEFSSVRPAVNYNSQCIVAEAIRPIVHSLLVEFSISADKANLMLDQPSNHGGWPNGPSRSAYGNKPVVDEIYDWFVQMGFVS